MKKTIYFLVVSLMLSGTSVYASKNNFQFQINEYHTQRQSGQTVEVYVRYALKDTLENSLYPDYKDLRTVALSYLEPTKALPVNTYWEFIATAMGDELMKTFPLSGVSVQLLVHANETGEIYEPGFHGPIYTVGDVIPLNQIVTFGREPKQKKIKL